MVNPVRYLHQVAVELRKVSWPTATQTTQKTLLVLGVSLIVGLYIALIDQGFQRLIQTIITYKK